MKPSLERYVELVRSGPSGLFSRGDLERLDQHALDGAAGAAVIAALGAGSLVDIGSGGGVPAIPLALELPQLQLTLVESQGWKAEFLRTCVRALGLESRVSVLAERAETAPAAIGRERFDVGVARAVAAPLVVAEYLAPLVRVDGHLVLWTTRRQVDETDVDAPAATLLGLGPPELRSANSQLRGDGVLLVWPRVSPCTDRVPRRPGVAARRPLR